MPINGFFEKWDELEEKFSGWHVEHSGGGIWILQKELPNKKGKPTLVSVSSQQNVCVFATGHRDEESFLDTLMTKDEYESALKDWSEDPSLEVVIYDEDELKLIASSIFHQEELEEILSVLDKLS